MDRFCNFKIIMNSILKTTIINRSPQSFPFSKDSLIYFFKKFSGRVRGPEAVLGSLVRGLDSIGNFPFQINPTPNQFINQSNGIVHIISNANALSWAIEQKKSGKIKKILAGPTLAITPFDHKNILQDPNIDIILVPSEWVKDFYTSLAPVIAPKIRVWASGVVETPASDKSGAPIFYIKNEDQKLIDSVTKTLEKSGRRFQVLRYGNFKKPLFTALLKSAPWMIYLGKSESQGLALHQD